MNPSGTIVVGVDGSPESGAAIEFAMREAMRRGAWLRVVAAAHLPEYWTIAYGTADLPSPEEVIARRAAVGARRHQFGRRHGGGADNGRSAAARAHQHANPRLACGHRAWHTSSVA